MEHNQEDPWDFILPALLFTFGFVFVPDVTIAFVVILLKMLAVFVAAFLSLGIFGHSERSSQVVMVIACCICWIIFFKAVDSGRMHVFASAMLEWTPILLVIGVAAALEERLE